MTETEVELVLTASVIAGAEGAIGRIDIVWYIVCLMKSF